MKTLKKTATKVKKSLPQARKEQKAKKRHATKPIAAKKTGAQGSPIGKKQTKYDKPGQPTKKNAEILTVICEGIAVGKSSRAMCLDVGISQPTLWKWLGEDGEFSKRYARAKEDCADYLAAEIIEIADDGRNDTQVTEDGNVITDHDVIARSRLRVDARKWYASKLAPKKYGERLEHANNPDNPMPSQTTVIIVPAKNAA